MLLHRFIHLLPHQHYHHDLHLFKVLFFPYYWLILIPLPLALALHLSLGLQRSDSVTDQLAVQQFPEYQVSQHFHC
jgi:hypothetical protein